MLATDEARPLIMEHGDVSAFLTKFSIGRAITLGKDFLLFAHFRGALRLPVLLIYS
jgi:hypothetical protein